MFNGDTTYDNRTEEIQWGRGTTYREGNHRVAGTGNLLDVDWEASVTRAAVHMGVRDGDANRAPGHIQSAPSRD